VFRVEDREGCVDCEDSAAKGPEHHPIGGGRTCLCDVCRCLCSQVFYAHQRADIVRARQVETCSEEPPQLPPMTNVVKHFVGHAYNCQLQEQGYSSITQDDNRLTPDGLSSATSMLAHHNTSAAQGRELQLNIQKAKATIHDNSLEEVRRKRRAVMAANTNPLTAGIQGEQRFFRNHLSPTPIASKTVVSTVPLEEETLQMEIAMAESLTGPVKESRAVAGWQDWSSLSGTSLSGTPLRIVGVGVGAAPSSLDIEAEQQSVNSAQPRSRKEKLRAKIADELNNISSDDEQEDVLYDLYGRMEKAGVGVRPLIDTEIEDTEANGWDTPKSHKFLLKNQRRRSRNKDKA
jgi:hypothetical protein